MKITFFLIAFCLVFVRLYLGWTGHWKNDGNDGTMTFGNGNDNFEIKWSGKVRLNDDETAIESITPGGYLKFSHNDEKMIAESNLQGDIRYSLYDGRQQLAMDEKGKKFLAGAVHTIVEVGFDAQDRMDRLYKKGGIQALLGEIEKLKHDDLKGMYIDRLLQNDSLARDDLVILVRQIGGLAADYEKENYLNRFNTDQLKDTSIMQAWLGAVAHVGGDMQKNNLLRHLIDLEPVSDEVFGKIVGIMMHFGEDWNKEQLLSTLIEKDSIPADRIDKLLDVIGGLGADQSKENMLSKLIDRDAVPEERFHRLLEMVGHLNTDFNRQQLYKKLMARKGLTEGEWVSLLDGVSHIGSDFDKSNLLVEMAAKIPKSDTLKATYLKVAKTITNDMDYGRAMRAVE
jgi:hypothetical protein